jgi:putative oxidoreductase
MRIVNLVANILVGLVYTVFGANFFFQFIPMPPMEGDAGSFIGVLASSGTMAVVKILEIAGGLMLLSGFQRPLGYVILMPITIVIVLFEVFIAKTPGIGIALLALLSFLIWANKERFMPVVA